MTENENYKFVFITFSSCFNFLFLYCMFRNDDFEGIKACFTTIQKFCANIVKDPSNPKVKGKQKFKIKVKNKIGFSNYHAHVYKYAIFCF